MSIPKSTLSYLGDLAQNNNREWFADHKNTYEEQRAYVKEWSEELLTAMREVDDIELVKLHRIYRDVRFSKDKTPYKTNFSGYMKRATSLRRGGYYFHIEPGNCFLGGGFWGPESADLKRIRQEFARDPDEFRSIITDKNFKKHFGNLEGEQLKSSPRGYDKDHPAVDLLRYKQFLVRKDFSDSAISRKDFTAKVAEGFAAMRPFFDYMSDVLTTDLNGQRIV